MPKSVGPQLGKKRPSWHIFPNKAIKSAPYSPDKTLNATTQVRQLYYAKVKRSHVRVRAGGPLGGENLEAVVVWAVGELCFEWARPVLFFWWVES